MLSPREMDLRARADRCVAALAGERAPLVRAVLAAPADDAPRLIYADWLDEHGEPDLAALIRRQVRTGLDVVPSVDVGDPEDIRGARRCARRRAWGPFPAPSTSTFPAFDLLAVVARGFPAVVAFNTPEHAMRWARAVGTWLPVREVLIRCCLASERNPGRDGSYLWAPYARRPLPGRPWMIPAALWPFLRADGWIATPPGQDCPDARGRPGRPIRLIPVYGTLARAEDALARATADYCRRLAGYDPVPRRRAEDWPAGMVPQLDELY